MDSLPDGWSMQLPGYAVDSGQDKHERRAPYHVRWCDARWGNVITHSDDGRGVPTEVVLACISAAKRYPAHSARELRSLYPGKFVIPADFDPDYAKENKPKCLG